MKLIIALTGFVLITACATANAPRSEGYSGEELYARNCAACHGPYAEGDGPVASVMTMNVPNLRELTSRNNGRFPREAVLEYIDGRRLIKGHGDRYMPVWGTEFRLMDGDDAAAERTAQAKIEALTAFIASIQYEPGDTR